MKVSPGASSPSPRVIADPHGPAERDLVIAYASGNPPSYTIRQLPATAQLHTPSREVALRLARAFAATHGVDVWFSDSQHYELVAQHRQRAAVVVNA